MRVFSITVTSGDEKLTTNISATLSGEEKEVIAVLEDLSEGIGTLIGARVGLAVAASKKPAKKKRHAAPRKAGRK